MKTVDYVKWTATLVQLVGYGLTGLHIVPYNVYLFFAGIFLWFVVGYMWRDKAIMLVHVGAFLALLGGHLHSYIDSAFGFVKHEVGAWPIWQYLPL